MVIYAQHHITFLLCEVVGDHAKTLLLWPQNNGMEMTKKKPNTRHELGTRLNLL